MNTFADEAPGSPPGLTASKSSKSSTNPSSSSTSGDGILSDATHFEDIGLHEELAPPVRPKPQNGSETQSQATPHAVTAAMKMNRHRSNAPVMTAMRDLTNQKQPPSFPPPPGPCNAPGPQHTLSLPNGVQMRRFSRNASTPSLAIRAMSNYNRSRSPSPSTSPPLPQLFSGARAPVRPASASGQTSPVPVRRGSWQPNKKSVKELEAECNDEDEEDLPDEASLWNVPISPRPPTERSVTLSPVPSPRVSQDGVQHTAPKTAPIPTTRRTLPADFPSSPSSPRRLLRGAMTGKMPNAAQYQRSKSWNIALSGLSEEAKALTQSLESHANEREKIHENAIQNGSIKGMRNLTKVKTAPIVQLPPLRANNVMIDPLPISKEKEKVLSRTRPSWLPPKDKSEEKKHLKQYQRMMELSREAERRKVSKVADSQCAKDDTKITLARLWEQHVLPHWDQVIREPRTRELWWRGVGPKSRAQVWSRAIGNDLALTDTTYKKALQRARKIEADLKRSPSNTELHRRERHWFDAVGRDVLVTLPKFKVFQPNAPLHDTLIDVLKAYSMYRSDVGYSHGTHLIAAFLLLNLPTPSETFVTLANLLNRPLPLTFLTGDPAGENKAYTLTLNLLRKKYPRLHSHLFGFPPNSNSFDDDDCSNKENIAALNGLGLSTHSLHLVPQEILEPMFRTLFLGPGNDVSIDIVARVWDVMVFDGDAALIRTAVAILGSLEGKLYGTREDVLGILGWRGELGDLGDEDAFMKMLRWVGKEAVPRSSKK